MLDYEDVDKTSSCEKIVFIFLYDIMARNVHVIRHIYR